MLKMALGMMAKIAASKVSVKSKGLHSDTGP
jgi:hypothetical protein